MKRQTTEYNGPLLKIQCPQLDQHTMCPILFILKWLQNYTFKQVDKWYGFDIYSWWSITKYIVIATLKKSTWTDIFQGAHKVFTILHHHFLWELLTPSFGWRASAITDWLCSFYIQYAQTLGWAYDLVAGGHMDLLWALMSTPKHSTRRQSRGSCCSPTM